MAPSPIPPHVCTSPDRLRATLKESLAYASSGRPVLVNEGGKTIAVIVSAQVAREHGLMPQCPLDDDLPPPVTYESLGPTPPGGRTPLSAALEDIRAGGSGRGSLLHN